MQESDDTRNLAELFSRAAKVSRSKIDAAIKENDIISIIKNPALIPGTTDAERRRIEDLIEFTGLYEAVRTMGDLGFQITGPEGAYQYFAQSMSNLTHERIDMILLDTRHRIIKRMTLADGTLAGAAVYAQKIARTALIYNANSVILAHNHPSGDSRPSIPDEETTAALNECFKTIGVEFVDHLVIGKNGYTSIREHSPDVFAEGEENYYSDGLQSYFFETLEKIQGGKGRR